MPSARTLFLDFDDTLSDPFLFHSQYVRELGLILADAYGGDAERWSIAAIDLLVEVEEEYVRRFVRRPLNGYYAWLNTVRVRSAHQMFDRMGIDVPPSPARVARDSQFSALLRCNAIFPGVEPVLHEICSAGYEIHIASGQESDYLTAALRAAGLEDITGVKFGPDLIDCAKEGPEYFERAVARVGASAVDCVLVDDFPPAIEWAKSAGLQVIQSGLSRDRHYDRAEGVVGVMRDFRELPDLLAAAFSQT